MVCARFNRRRSSACWLLFFCLPRMRSQNASQAPLDVSGQINVAGRSTLPHPPSSGECIPSFRLPFRRRSRAAAASFPKPTEAHRPENVVHASFRRPRLFRLGRPLSANAPRLAARLLRRQYADPMILATAPETERLQSHGSKQCPWLQLGHRSGVC